MVVGPQRGAPADRTPTSWANNSTAALGVAGAVATLANSTVATAPRSVTTASDRAATAANSRAGAVLETAGSSVSAGAASKGPPTRVKATALNLNSGCNETGSTASLVTALIAKSSPKTSLQ